MSAENIGPRLRQIRKLRGLTQQVLGERLGLAHRSATVTVCRWESGATMPSLPRLFDIAKALEVDALELLRPVSVDGSL